MTDKESKLSEITIVETELSVPRKGSVRVRIDLDNRILSWRESNRWNRNFTRTINQREVNMVRREITKNDLFKSERPAVRNLEQALHLPCSWEVSIYFEDAEPFKVWHGFDMEADGFSEWTELMGLVCRQPFDVFD